MKNKNVELIKIIKIHMIKNNRDDFCAFLSEMLGISIQSASNRLNGKVNLSIEELKKIAKELNINSYELFESIA